MPRSLRVTLHATLTDEALAHFDDAIEQGRRIEEGIRAQFAQDLGSEAGEGIPNVQSCATHPDLMLVNSLLNQGAESFNGMLVEIVAGQEPPLTPSVPRNLSAPTSSLHISVAYEDVDDAVPLQDDTPRTQTFDHPKATTTHKAGNA